MQNHAKSYANHKPATTHTRERNRQWYDQLPFADRADHAAARRGFIATTDRASITREHDDHTIWDFNAYRFLDEADAPDTVHPSLWRQAQLNNITGLFKVCDRIYQIRGFDLSNMTIVEGDSGIIIIDPLVSAEVARVALDMYYTSRPHKPVVAVIYSHSHIDHFGGVRGVVDEAEVDAGNVRIYAPDKFMQEVASEHVYAGPAMFRRVQYQVGSPLPTGPRAHVDSGLGKILSRGSITLIPPTHVITDACETHEIDGIEIEFMLTPGTEAPAEMHMYFPQQRALCAAENACHCMHNVLTLRGALVRDPRIWSHYLDVTLQRYGERADVMFIQHHWPVWGSAEIREVLAGQRDMYAFIHDETLRLMNHGLTPTQISNRLVSLPQPLAQQWFARDYYGTVSHNVRAVYQRYLGFYDGNPAHLDPLDPVDMAQRTIDWMGGADAVLTRAREAFDHGDYRWVVHIVNEVIFADPQHAEAKQLQADALEQLGYQCESAIWRNAYLTGAHELREGVAPAQQIIPPDLVKTLTPEMFFAFLAIRLDSEKASQYPAQFNWTFSNSGQSFALTVQNGVLTYRADSMHAQPTASICIDKHTMDRIHTQTIDFAEALHAGDIQVSGDAAAVTRFFASLDTFAPGNFNIVTPAVGP